MRWLTLAVFALMPVLALAQADDKTIELDRLRRENAQLRKDLATAKEQLAKVTAELEKAKAPAAAAAPPGVKPTLYTPELLVKLIPREDLPEGARWDPAKRERVKKILTAHLEGEWVQITLGAPEIPGGDDKPFKVFAHQPAGPLGVAILLDVVFAEKPAALGKRAGPITVVGKVRSAGLYPDDANQMIVALTDCRLAK